MSSLQAIGFHAVFLLAEVVIGFLFLFACCPRAHCRRLSEKEPLPTRTTSQSAAAACVVGRGTRRSRALFLRGDRRLSEDLLEKPAVKVRIPMERGKSLDCES